MKKNRRQFIKISGLASLGLTSVGILKGFASERGRLNNHPLISNNMLSSAANPDESGLSIIGQYGPWAAGLIETGLPSLSFRRNGFKNLDTWREMARKRAIERLAIPAIGKVPAVKVTRSYTYDGLHVEELTWQLPYGRPTEAILLKPLGQAAPLPGILAFHDHGGNKYFGTRKITRTADVRHPLIEAHQQEYYEKLAWANEVAKRGYVVLVPDAFPFASRRVKAGDVPEHLRHGLNDENPEDSANIKAYNDWAGNHEHIMSKSLFSAGTTWPGVFFAEDRVALDILCARKDVDAGRVGCAGLSGGGMRTVFMGGLDPRIRCAVCVGFMTTWKDFILNKSYTHTWMTYVPLLPNELDFPEIFALRAPMPTMVLNDENDELYTLPEMKRADQIIQDVFKKAGAADRYKCSFYPGPHKFDAAMQEEAFNWFDRWLKK